MYNIGMTEDSIAMAIIFNGEAHDLVEQHVRKLQEMGILELGIKGDKLDELMAELKKANVLVDDFAFLEAYQCFLIGDFVADINRQIAANLARNGDVTAENLTEKVREYIVGIEKPENAHKLYLEVMGLPHMNFRIMMQALHFAATKPGADFEKLEQLSRMIVDAIPVGTVLPDIPSKEWIRNNGRKYIRVDFSPVIKAVPFSNSYENMFSEGFVTLARSSKSDVESFAIDYLKALILEDVFEVLKHDRDRTSPRINAEIVKLAQNRFMYVCMRYIQAMAIVQADLAYRIRAFEAAKSTAETSPKYTYNGSFGNIPS